MVLFDWKKIVDRTGGKSKDILAIMHMLTFMTFPSDTKDVLYKYIHINFVGNSFAVTLQPFFYEAKNYTTRERLEYLSLLSRRSFAEYMHTHEVTLDLSHANLSQDIINRNRLLTLEDGLIHFKYEDIKETI